ncbi:nucleotide pyrophosphohydrolase [Archaeoglobus veneficus]|uniref:Putative pyrophosphatase n=1 Tax=Archaeoglobus veneficus (strain DSM 11195 / SNP6) TaxID=693661 RepID=F2KP33_ARCVS|nr:nucleotide pyrophosphohydrolase [Archaeoglobus veneficus]AEA46341.1 putative pyrophosphatase [Archaeoglobus veneficus SNP6]
MDIEELRRILVKFRDERDWKKFHNPKDLTISICIESAELLQHFQWIDCNDVWKVAKERREKIEGEMADILIYLIYLADVLEIDLGEAVVEKVRKNEERYPVDKVKGKAKKYTEL